MVGSGSNGRTYKPLTRARQSPSLSKTQPGVERRGHPQINREGGQQNKNKIKTNGNIDLVKITALLVILTSKSGFLQLISKFLS